MKNYKYEAVEILEEYVNAYSHVDIERLARKLEEIAKDTAREILAMFNDRNYISENELKKAIAERYGVGVE